MNDLQKWMNLGQQQPQYKQEFTGTGFRQIYGIGTRVPRGY